MNPSRYKFPGKIVMVKLHTPDEKIVVEFEVDPATMSQASNDEIIPLNPKLP